MGDNNKEFLIVLIEFYDLTFDNLARVIKKLAEIQKEFKPQYEGIKKLQLDPSKMDELLKNLTDDQRGFLLKLFMKSASFEMRMMNMFELSASDKEKLAEEILTFKKEITDKIKEIRD